MVSLDLLREVHKKLNKAVGLKDDDGYNPSGLVAGSLEDGGKGVIYVALNYRLGMYGWLNPLGDKSIFPNVGLQDQLMGLEW